MLLFCRASRRVFRLVDSLAERLGQSLSAGKRLCADVCTYPAVRQPYGAVDVGGPVFPQRGSDQYGGMPV